MKNTEIYFIPLNGNIEIEKLHQFQEKVIKKYTTKGINIIYTPQIEKTITYGSRSKKNSLNPNFETLMHSQYQDRDLKKVLLDFEGIPFRKSLERGGGSTYLHPEQCIFFLNLNLRNEYSIFDLQKDLTQAIKDTISEIISNNNSIKFETDNSETLLMIEDKKYKISSIGIRESIKEGGKISNFGISIYPTYESIQGFKIVNPCGIPPEIAEISYLQKFAQTNKSQIYQKFINNFVNITSSKIKKDEKLETKIKRLYDHFRT